MRRKLEELAPANYMKILDKRRCELENILRILEKRLVESRELEGKGHIRVQGRGKSVSYYLITKKGDSNGNYLQRKDAPLVEALVQRDYEKRAFRTLEQELACIRRLLKAASRNVESVYGACGRNRRALVKPVTLPRERYVSEWLSVKYAGKKFHDDAAELYTASGVRVRSKSEAIIGDYLDSRGIPYRYEFPLRLKDGVVVHPDFCCLRADDRTEILWEHFGLMDDPAYAGNAVRKVALYQRNGFFQGKNIVFSFETRGEPLSVKTVGRLAAEIFS